MAGIKLVVTALLIACASAQMPIQGFFNVPGTAFNRGGRVDFTGLSLGQICKQIMMTGGKEALSDGMGMAAKWLSSQKIASNIAGGTDPQMECLYSQATGAMMPGTIGNRDPGNMFGDYYDTVIEYPMILDPCTAPQCNGKVNPTALLMQAFAPMMRMGGGMGGMGGGMGGMGGMGGGMGGAPANLYSATGQNSLLSALMPKQNAGPAVPAPTGNGTNTSGPANPAVPNAVSPTATSQGNPMTNMLQNPQMMQMMQQLMNMFNPRQAGASPNPGGAGFPGFNPFGNMNGFPMFR